MIPTSPKSLYQTAPKVKVSKWKCLFAEITDASLVFGFTENGLVHARLKHVLILHCKIQSFRCELKLILKPNYKTQSVKCINKIRGMWSNYIGKHAHYLTFHFISVNLPIDLYLSTLLTDKIMETEDAIAGFHMKSLNFKLQNYWSSWNVTFMMNKSC